MSLTMTMQLKSRSGRISGSAKPHAKVLRRDPCSYCSGEGGTVDHIVSYKLGGGGSAANLAGACPDCNVEKGDTKLLLFLLQRAASQDAPAPQLASVA